MRRTRPLPAIARQYLLDSKARLRTLLDNSHLSYSYAAHLIGVNPSTVSRWVDDEHGGFINLEDAVLLCLHLGISVQQMLPAPAWLSLSESRHDQRAVFLSMSDAEVEWLLSVWSGAVKVYR
ncbi:helix-turn-helix domain-containing protein [Aeromonas hydrophila]|uniref:helix-turn-helix domain-containing protein n=1 Tax=Aeromonas hydrophila TaxID=644 RepID=UPI003F78E597